ncbi:MAG: hypothetical protein ACKOWN_01510 [Microbacteriaceae bacterium]
MAAKDPQRAVPERWRRLSDALNSNWLFRWQSLGLYALISIPFVSISEYNRLVRPSLLSALGIASLAVGLTVVLILISSPIIHATSRWRVTTTFVTLATIGIVRATIVSAIIDGFDINRDSFFLSRMMLSAGAVPVMAITSTFIVATLARGWRQRAESRREIAELRAERDAILAELGRADEMIVTESENTLRPRVDAILSSLRTATRQVIGASLENLITEVVRPLSHSLAANARSHQPSTDSVRLKASRPQFPTADSFVGPLSTSAAVYLTTIVSLFDVVPIGNALVGGLFGAFVTWAGLRIFQALMSGVTMSVRLVVSIVVLAHLGVALVVAWVTISAFAEYRVGLEIMIGLIAATLVPGLLYFAQRLVTYLGELRLSQLAAARREMSLEVSEVRRRAWLRQRHIAHALHSAIQSRVHAESQLVRNGAGKVSVEESARITATLSSMFEILRNTDEGTANAAEELRRAIEFWSGMCTISFSLNPDVEQILARDPDIGEAVLLTSLEVINNAIRHGKATELSLTIDLTAVDLIRIVGVNNGKPLGTPTPGLGMSIFDELTAYWTITGEEATTFTGYIAARHTDQ